ncbi:hypothetical protein G7939_02320 [Ralstonia solanacearum]|uniref:asparagine synthetase B family protein n=1 Tax=Ralstonia pseudosolanacearum TaxID=1310165 RepID=UPI0013F4BFA1|nr:asparagine synthase-related protein [Ralstonia pseudosolanacearum]MCK4120271.1 hypothetical protein [Ralstonia pseudosolanacearum]QIK22363.1 hypothetical protein G7939_02320 [Ralstonia solanacearum]QIK29601.1 hypothetical protein G7947_15505 [Ralstonia solanacearum]QIK34506.1 hypothetical protein G7969_15505 [Ralstonia solanacearum]
MCSRQAHRGPDASGQAIGSHLALFHNKLTITTTGPDSDQPFSWGDFQCAFVGEIYNHNTLAQRIGATGGRFDGRVIPVGFATTGLQFLGGLEGEFAVVVADASRNAITLSRDRAGARNLYFAKASGDCWVFSTELSALVREPAINPKVDDVAMLGQLLLQEWTPRLGTCFENIYQVPPGTAVTLGNGLPHVEAYPFDFNGTDNRAEILVNAVKARLEHSQLVSGCLAFSGGLDSTAIATVSAAFAAPMPTFTVVSSLDDPIAMRVRRLSEDMPWLQPRMVLLRSDEISDARLSELTAQLASPVCDTTPFALSAVFREASCQGFRYCLSGEGSDDLWAGYAAETPFLRQDSIASAYQSLIDRVRESCFVEFSRGQLRRVPLINQEAAQTLVQRLSDLLTDLSNAAEAQSLQVSGRPLAVLSVLGPLRRSLEQVDCLAGLYSMEARVPYCSARLMSLPWSPEWYEGKQWVRDMLPDRIRTGLDWTKESFATRRFNDTALNENLDMLVDEVLATRAIATYLDPTVDGSILRMLAATNSKLWWSMVGIARFCTVHCKS